MKKINLSILLSVTALSVALWSKDWHNPVAHAYLNDVMLCFGGYFFNRFMSAEFNSKFGKNKWRNSGCLFSAASICELAQKYGLAPGTYDTKDFLAYAIGTSAALGLDILIDKVTKK